MDQFDLGWSPRWDHHLHQSEIKNFVRISARHKSWHEGIKADGSRVHCHSSGKMLNGYSEQVPTVGDWCKLGASFLDESGTTAHTIVEILPRFSRISRMNAGLETNEQVIAANIDYVFIVTSANSDFNIGRLRRYLLLAKHGGAIAIIVLSKADIATDTAEFTEQLKTTFPEVDYIVTSAVDSTGLERIEAILSNGRTGVFVGSSGVGKSSLVNAMLSKEVQKTNDIRAQDQRGRHTTSSSGLFFTTHGGIIIDSPGLREVQVLGDESDLVHVMPTVAQLATQCKFRNCTHKNEPGCAIVTAVSSGEVTELELTSYSKLKRELNYAKRRVDQRLASEERKKWKKISVEQRQRRKEG